MTRARRFCHDPHCPCQLLDRSGEGWRLGNASAACGTVSCYSSGCRCADCRAAAAAARRKIRAKARVA